jgi:hypothetical protein
MMVEAKVTFASMEDYEMFLSTLEEAEADGVIEEPFTVQFLREIHVDPLGFCTTV